MKNIELIKNGVYLWPFTAETAVMIHVLQENGIECLAVFDNDKTLQGKTYSGIKILKADWATDMPVIICGYRHYNLETRFTKSIRIENVLSKDDAQFGAERVDVEKFAALAPKQLDRMLHFDIEIRHLLLDKNIGKNDLVLNSLGEILTTRCNLRCDGCSELMPYYKHPKDLPLEKLMSDADEAMSKVDFVRKWVILGGESFLYKELPAYLEHMTKYHDRIGYIHVTTNGTIVPDDKVLKSLAEYDMGLYISDYGDVSKKLFELESKARDFGVNVRVNKQMTWQSICQPHPRDENGQKNWDSCWERNICWAINDGRLYYCDFILSGEALQIFPYDPYNSLNLYTASKQDVKKYFYERKNAPDACSYCSGCDRNYPDIPAGRQLEKTLELPFSYPETYGGIF